MGGVSAVPALAPCRAGITYSDDARAHAQQAPQHPPPSSARQSWLGRGLGGGSLGAGGVGSPEISRPRSARAGQLARVPSANGTRGEVRGVDCITSPGSSRSAASSPRTEILISGRAQAVVACRFILNWFVSFCRNFNLTSAHSRFLRYRMQTAVHLLLSSHLAVKPNPTEAARGRRKAP